jgi:hypothetical protein
VSFLRKLSPFSPTGKKARFASKELSSIASSFITFFFLSLPG